MSRLSQVHKHFIVQRLGCYCSLSEVRDQFKEEFGITAETAQLARYKPGTIAGAGLCQELREEHDAARLEFLSDGYEIPILNKNYRARELQSLYEQTKHKDPIAAARLLEQAAKESGNAFMRLRDSAAETSRDHMNEVIEREIAEVWGQETAESPTAESPTAETPDAVTPSAVTPSAAMPNAVTPTARSLSQKKV